MSFVWSHSLVSFVFDVWYGRKDRKCSINIMAALLGLTQHTRKNETDVHQKNASSTYGNRTRFLQAESFMIHCNRQEFVPQMCHRIVAQANHKTNDVNDTKGTQKMT